MSSDTSKIIEEAKQAHSFLRVRVSANSHPTAVNAFAAPLLRDLIAAGVYGLPLYFDRTYWRDQAECLRRENGIRVEVRKHKRQFFNDEIETLHLLDNVELVG